eukprot:5524986-Pleurochrysis_carterae.AAC.4
MAASQGLLSASMTKTPTGLCFVANFRTSLDDISTIVDTSYSGPGATRGSSATGSDRARKHSERGGQGGAGARLLKPHRVHLGNGHAAKGGTQALQVRDTHALIMYPCMHDGV